MTTKLEDSLARLCDRQREKIKRLELKISELTRLSQNMSDAWAEFTEGEDAGDGMDNCANAVVRLRDWLETGGK